MVLANKTTNCQENFTKQNTGMSGGCRLFKKCFQPGLKDSVSSSFFTAVVSNSVGWLSHNSQEYFILDPRSLFLGYLE